MMKLASLFKISFVALSFILPANVVIAESNPTGISFFRASPRLVDSNTSFRSPNVLSRYNFIIDIPANADNNLAKIVINQQSNLEIIKIYPEDIKVVILTENEEIPVNNSTKFLVDKDENTSKIAIDLSQPISPNSKIKVALRAKNPLYGGIYQFGVEVYPQGNNPRSLYLGIARFHFYQNGRF